MSSGWDLIGEAGLQFFGKMTASISHEIKNALAIINENAGLLEDFALMAGEGKPVNPERLQNLAMAVTKQIRRADGIIKNLNRFAHSVDEPVAQVNLSDLVKLLAFLCERPATMRGVSLEPNSGSRPVLITTNPFFLMALIWLCLEFVIDSGEGRRRVGLIAEEAEKGARIRITNLEGLRDAQRHAFPSAGVKALVSTLKAGLSTDPGTSEFVITLPEYLER